MRNLYMNNIFHISADAKYVKGDGDDMLEKMVEKVVERKMLELVGDYFKGDGDVMLEKMVEGVVERRMLELVGDRNDVDDRLTYGCYQTKYCVEELGLL